MSERLTLDEARRLTPDELEAHWPEVTALLSGKTAPEFDEDTDWSAMNLRELPPEVLDEYWDQVSAEMARRAEEAKERDRLVKADLDYRLWREDLKRERHRRSGPVAPFRMYEGAIRR